MDEIIKAKIDELKAMMPMGYEDSEGFDDMTNKKIIEILYLIVDKI